MSSTSRRQLALALVLITPAFWGVNYLVARSAPAVIEPHLLALLRWFAAGLLFAAPAWRELVQHRTHIAREWRRFLVLGALGMWICGAWVYIGGRTTAAVNIALIYALSPVLIALVSALWLKERFDRVQALGVALALAGVVHVILKGQWASLAGVTLVIGDAWIFAATVSWTLYSVLLKRWQSPLSPMARLAAISAAGVLVLLPFTAWEIAHATQPALTWPGFGLAMAAAVIPGFAAYLAYAVMQRELGAARVAVVLYLGPLYAAGLAWLVLGEPLYAFHAAGMVLVLAGIYLVNRAGTR
ncbi:DMT family transporter [Pseudorhodoferax sp. Leaf267]|uniref:DMT family transporter n=1 Tax=Pseudorhodoferax sp. Leaf267 TaxID=1736316 RepID=UPI0006FF5966|nr:DMT family transporter [Pseudorhodoferax sp. Leaf267]KQP19246.1 multidrug DMT transporter permease [Pseudorhodoferax sp. Leaf267]